VFGLRHRWFLHTLIRLSLADTPAPAEIGYSAGIPAFGSLGRESGRIEFAALPAAEADALLDMAGAEREPAGDGRGKAGDAARATNGTEARPIGRALETLNVSERTAYRARRRPRRRRARACYAVDEGGGGVGRAMAMPMVLKESKDQCRACARSSVKDLLAPDPIRAPMLRRIAWDTPHEAGG
jgi:hypothetical protein